jgi:hypothetical protein
MPNKKHVSLRHKLKRHIDMNLLNFSTVFPDEASCKAKWKAMRNK